MGMDFNKFSNNITGTAGKPGAPTLPQDIIRALLMSTMAIRPGAGAMPSMRAPSLPSPFVVSTPKPIPHVPPTLGKPIPVRVDNRYLQVPILRRGNVIGDAIYRLDTRNNSINIASINIRGHKPDANNKRALSVSDVRELSDQILQLHPGFETITGVRGSGAKIKNRIRGVGGVGPPRQTIRLEPRRSVLENQPTNPPTGNDLILRALQGRANPMGVLEHTRRENARNAPFRANSFDHILEQLQQPRDVMHGTRVLTPANRTPAQSGELALYQQRMQQRQQQTERHNSIVADAIKEHYAKLKKPTISKPSNFANDNILPYPIKPTE